MPLSARPCRVLENRTSPLAERRIDAIGPTTDVYGLATILYEMRTGQVSGATQLPLPALGAVRTFAVNGDSNPYLAAANGLNNNVLLYHYASAGSPRF